MNATELFHADGNSSGIFYCSECKRVAHSKQLAEQCCTPPVCRICGKETSQKYRLICRPCKIIKDENKEAARFEKAEKITSWDGPVFLDGAGYNEGYFPDFAELADWIDGEESELPRYYVWTCISLPICHLNCDKIIENATQDAYEDWDTDSLMGVDELRSAMEAFNAKNASQVYWEPNYKVALLL